MIAIRDRNKLKNKVDWLERVKISVWATVFPFVIGPPLRLTYVWLLLDFCVDLFLNMSLARSLDRHDS